MLNDIADSHLYGDQKRPLSHWAASFTSTSIDFDFAIAA
jgi:hypothetical protein